MSEERLEPGSRIKTFWMVSGLAAFVMIGAACFGLFRSPPPDEPSCDGLSGQAKIDCENRSER